MKYIKLFEQLNDPFDGGLGADRKIVIRSARNRNVVIKIYFDENNRVIEIDNEFSKKYPFPPIREGWGPWIGRVVDIEEINNFLNWKYRNDLYITDEE